MFREHFRADDLFDNLDVEIPVALPERTAPGAPPNPRPRARRAPSLGDPAARAEVAPSPSDPQDPAEACRARGGSGTPPSRRVYHSPAMEIHRLPEDILARMAGAAPPSPARNEDDLSREDIPEESGLATGYTPDDGARADPKPYSNNNHSTDDDSVGEEEGGTPRARRRRAARILRRVVLAAAVVIICLAVGAGGILAEIFHGPSDFAAASLAVSMRENRVTAWIPALFLGGEEKTAPSGEKVTSDASSESSPIKVLPPQGGSAQGDSSAEPADPFADCPDGILPGEGVYGSFSVSYLRVRDPARIVLSTSSPIFSRSLPGTRATDQIEHEGGDALLNGGDYFDDGSDTVVVGSEPLGLVISRGRVLFDDGDPRAGFVGFDEDGKLVVLRSATREDAERLHIRDGCSAGPVLLEDGTLNEDLPAAGEDTTKPRSAIAQMTDGSVLLVAVDGRQPGSLGATSRDLAAYLSQAGAVQAAELAGGTASTLLYRDSTGRFGEAGKVVMMNRYPLMQAEPRRLPTFFLVTGEGVSP